MRPGIVLVARPTFRTVSIMPGMELRAPERQETSSGFSGSPKFIPMAASTFLRAAATCFSRPAGYAPPFRKKSVQHSVVIVKPAGTGSPMVAISARFAPLPPSRFFMEASPSDIPFPKRYTYFTAFSAGAAAFFVLFFITFPSVFFFCKTVRISMTYNILPISLFTNSKKKKQDRFTDR